MSRKTKIGIQGSVIGWDDPWHHKLCSVLMRTGEGKLFHSQDPLPSPERFIQLLKSLGADMYVHHVMPNEEEIANFIEDFGRYEMSFMLGNEYGNINGPFTPGYNRYDIPRYLVDKAKQTGWLAGLVYDETEHLQLHPDIYTKNLNPDGLALEKQHQWTTVENKSIQEIERDIAASASAVVQSYGEDVPLFSEHVFPVMYHTLARGGFHPCPKLLKEEFQSLQLATALGAAKQYDRSLGICVDLWGPDVGSWFTRIWAFPGHPPQEFKSALELAYLMGPDLLYVENIDPLAKYDGEQFLKTEYGEIFENFTRKFIKETNRPYHHGQADPNIVIIRADESDFNSGILFGNPELRSTRESVSVFQAFHLLSRGSLPPNGNTFFLPQFDYPASRITRNEQNLKALPLAKGVLEEEATLVHPLFYPLNNVLVFDENIDGRRLGNPKLIVLAGSRITEACLKAVEERVRGGALCVAAEWLLPEGNNRSRKDGMGRWIVTTDFMNEEVKDAVEPYLGNPDIWKHRFGDYELCISNPNADGISLEFEIIAANGRI